MRLPSDLVPAIVSVLLLVGGGAMTWMNARFYMDDLRHYTHAELTTVTLEAIRVTPRQVSLETRMETFIDVLLRARRNGMQLDLSATFVGATPEHVADVKFLASHKGKQIQLWIEPDNPHSFSLHHRYPTYQVGPLIICAAFTLLGAWVLYRIVKPSRARLDTPEP
jgi:hypothetical protein